jgi:hypothetical protein
MHRLSIRLALVLGLLFGALPSALRAEEVSAKFGIIGLFSPDRQQDLRDVLEDVPEVQLARIDFDTAEVTLRYDLEKLFPNFNPKKPPKDEEVFQRLTNLLNNASRGGFRLKPRSTIAEDKLTKVEIDIGILDCKACRFGAYRTVTRIEGVERAIVSEKPSRVTAWIDAQHTNRAALEDALRKAGVGLPAK